MDVSIRSLSKTYESKHEKNSILNQVTFHVKKGEWANVIGPSGSGKTTLLECISGILLSDNGSEIEIGNTKIQELNEADKREFRRENIGFIYQDYKLFPAYTALQNVMLPEWPYQKESELRTRAELLLTQFNLEGRKNAVPKNLSGGEKQRVAIARALLNNPSILLCDEPTGNLDEASRNHVLEILKECQAEGKTILFVTHDLEILQYGDRTFEIKDGQFMESEIEVNRVTIQ